MTTNTSSKFSVLRTCRSIVRLRLFWAILTSSCCLFMSSCSAAFHPPHTTPHLRTFRQSTAIVQPQEGVVTMQSFTQHYPSRSVTKDSTSRPSSSCLFNSINDDVASSPVASWTQEDVMDFATSQGINLTFSTLGPGYRVVARALHDSDVILGYCEGFVRPPPQQILHLDKMEVFRKKVQQASRESDTFQARSGSSFGMGLLMGLVCVLHGQRQNCQQAEFLAIDDRPEQHRKLVQYYKRSGFEIIKYVGDDFQDIPDRLVWGGCGTLMRQDVATLVQSWSETLTKSRAKLEKRNTAQT